MYFQQRINAQPNMIFGSGYPFHGWLLFCFPSIFVPFFLLLIFFIVCSWCTFKSLKLSLLHCCISSTHMHNEYCILYMQREKSAFWIWCYNLKWTMVKRAFVAAFRIRFLIHTNGNTSLIRLNGPFTWKKSFQHRQPQTLCHLDRLKE